MKTMRKNIRIYFWSNPDKVGTSQHPPITTNKVHLEPNNFPNDFRLIVCRITQDKRIGRPRGADWIEGDKTPRRCRPLLPIWLQVAFINLFAPPIWKHFNAEQKSPSCTHHQSYDCCSRFRVPRGTPYLLSLSLCRHQRRWWRLTALLPNAKKSKDGSSHCLS